MNSFTHEFKPPYRSYYYTPAHQLKILWIFRKKELIVLPIRDAMVPHILLFIDENIHGKCCPRNVY